MPEIPPEIKAEFDRVRYRLKTLEMFRREYKPLVDGLVNSKAIEDAVKGALQSQRRHLFTLPQKTAALILSVITVADFVLRLRGH